MITYFDTSMMVKLMIDDEPYRSESERLWLDSDYVICAEIGYVEARAALAAAQRNNRLDATAIDTAKKQFELLWAQVSILAVSTELVRAAAEVAERDGLRGYDAVHLAAALAGHASVVASADRLLVAAARRRGLSVVEPR